MPTLIKLLTWLLTLAAIAVALFGVLVVLDSRPLVPQDRTLTAAERAWAKGWLRAARPRGLQEGERTTLALSESEANILGSYLIDKLGDGRIAVRLQDNRARLAASLGLPWDPKGSFVNLELGLVGTERLPRIEKARLAGLPLPGGLAQRLADRLVGALDRSDLLHSVALKPDLVLLTYEWHRHALERVGSGLVSAEERARMLRYQALLVGYADRRPKGKPIALSDLLSHLLFEARYQGTQAGRAPAGGDPAAENRAVILALAAYANRRTVRDPADRGEGVPAIAFRTVELRGRRDLAQHFISSAALAAQGGDALADLLGLFKELGDSQGGSGFSFADLAADRAGTRFAQLATGDRRGALLVQAAAQQGLGVDDIMPPIDGLPEGIGKARFAADYQDTKSPAFRAIAERIERRIDRLTLHRAQGG